MDHRSVLLIGVVLGAAALANSACAGPAAGSVSFSEGTSDVSGKGAKEKAGSPDKSSPDAPAEGDAVFLATKFAAPAAAPVRAKGQAKHSVLPAPAGTTLDPSGQNCITSGCHVDRFAFGGTVYSDTSGKAPVAGAEVRVTQKDGTVYASAFSDQEGNFFVSAVDRPLPEGSRVGVRNATSSSLMNAPIAGVEGAKCNNATCHGSATFRIFL